MEENSIFIWRARCNCNSEFLLSMSIADGNHSVMELRSCVDVHNCFNITV